ncbi:MAG TPA: class I SAM-dependent RNA methyltransferase [Spirochaetia bacterium]|nr:class I SAM-dependent RNA methyltransferase [Spirochaetia bacterium]
MGAPTFTLEAAASFGLEALVRDELQGLGVRVLSTEDRRVVFEGSARDAARCNLRLRTADRVWLRLGEFPAATFDELYEGVRAVPWKDILPPSAAVDVQARSSKSRLASVPSIQSISKRALVDGLLGTGRPGARMDETGMRHDVEVVLRQDRASVLLDTSGQGLHKRGYRSETGPAPLRENLAAALVVLSRWDPARPFADPLCGSGTIAIEAAMAACGAAPGLNRGFAGEDLPILPRTDWRGAREEARAGVKNPAGLVIEASDHDAGAVEAARANARAAGVLHHIRFMKRSLDSFQSPGNYGCMVCNPPYGERLGDRREVEELSRHLGLLSRQLPTWSFFILTGSADFPKLFGARASRNRKLYNGNIRCWLYQYFGPLP